MKRVLSLLTVSVMIFVSTFTAFASTSQDNVIYTLAGYGIIDADAPTDAQVTRGEFARMVAKLMCYDEEDISASSKSRFWDVPETYEHSGAIELLAQAGILNGVSENMYAPLDAVTYEQAIKVLVVITGYGDMAMANGGWPGGYVVMAGRNGMFSGVNLVNPFSRADLYRLIYNTLDVRLIDEVISGSADTTLLKTDETLRDKLAQNTGEEHYRHTGVIIADSYSYTTSPYSDLEEDEVVIENRSVGGTYIYKIGKTNPFELVGCEVEFYAKETNGVYELLSVKPTVGKENIEISAENLHERNGNTISYENENGKMEKITLDGNIRVVYNGSRILSPGENIFDIADGYVYFIDNDSDSEYDLAMVWEYKNAVATNFDGQRFDFSNNALYNGKTSLFVDSENDDIKMIVTDAEGNSIESFDGEKTVSIFADREGTRYRVIVSDEQITGTFESIGDDVITVDGVDYKASASLTDEMLLGEGYLIYVNYEGKLAFAKAQEILNYGYILEYGSESGLASKVSAKLLLPGKVDDGVEINEEDVTDTSRVPYLILQNEGAQIFDFAETVRCQGSKYSGKALTELLSGDGMKAISYELNENGEISEITPLEKYGGDTSQRYQYNVYERVFGGTTVDQTSGFSLNSATKAVCVPVDDKNVILKDATDEDLALRVNITVANNDVGYRVEGYDYDVASKKVRFLVVHASMDSTLAPDVDVFSGKASIVTNVRYIVDSETGETEQEITLLNGSEEKILKPIEITSDNSKIETIKKGDLIVYTTNNNDDMENVFIVQSIPKLDGEFVSEAVSTSIKRTYGKTGNIVYDEVDTYNRRLITTVEVYAGSSINPRTFSVPQLNTPPVYIYDRGSQSYRSASVKDIRPDGEKIYIFERKGDSLIRAIVLVR